MLGEVVHGRRQFVPYGVLSSQITNETLALSCEFVLRDGRTLRGPLVLNQRKERSTVGPYAPNPPGNTRATKDGTMGSDLERGRQSRNPFVVRTEGCNPPSRRWIPY